MDVVGRETVGLEIATDIANKSQFSNKPTAVFAMPCS